MHEIVLGSLYEKQVKLRGDQDWSADLDSISRTQSKTIFSEN